MPQAVVLPLTQSVPGQDELAQKIIQYSKGDIYPSTLFFLSNCPSTDILHPTSSDSVESQPSCTNPCNSVLIDSDWIRPKIPQLTAFRYMITFSTQNSSLISI